MGSFCILIAYWNPINERIETFSFYILIVLKVINCRIIGLEKVWRQLILWNYYAGILILTLLSVVLFSENRVLICLPVSIEKYLVRHACIEIANRKFSTKNMQNIRLFSICSVTVMLSDLTILHFLAFLDEFFRTSYIDSY